MTGGARSGEARQEQWLSVWQAVIGTAGIFNIALDQK